MTGKYHNKRKRKKASEYNLLFHTTYSALIIPPPFSIIMATPMNTKYWRQLNKCSDGHYQIKNNEIVICFRFWQQNKIASGDSSEREI
jgi:hypothetical protein